MNTKTAVSQPDVVATLEYETPALVVIGDVFEVVLGVASGGFDGQFQMTEADFEFAADGDEE